MATIYTRKMAKGLTSTLQWTEKGRRYTKALGYVTAAQANIALLKHELDTANGVPIPVEMPFLEDYIKNDYLPWHEMVTATTTHERTIGMINKNIIPFFAAYRLDQINKRAVARYQQRQVAERKVKGATINKEIRTLKAILNHAVGNDCIVKNGISKVKMLPENDSKEVDYFTEDQLDLIYANAHQSYRWKFMANTGLRLGEVRHLKWKHITDSYINVESTEAERTKSGKWRMIPLGDKTRSALLELWQAIKGQESDSQYGDNGGYVFPRTAPNSLSQAARRSIQALDLEGSAHKFRHTYISLLAMKGVEPAKLQKLAGHASLVTTMRYMHLSPEYLSDVAEHC